MPANTFRRFVLILCAASAPAFAGVGATSSGVVPTGTAGSTDPSATVQQQSAGFVQQNQQQSNAANAANPSGTTTTATTINGVAQPGATASGEGKDKALDAAAGQAAAPAAPPVPPPPPPTYVSNIKHVNGAADTIAAGTTTTATTSAPAAAMPERSKPDTVAVEPEAVAAADIAPKTAPPRPAPAKPPVANANAAAAPKAAAKNPLEAAVAIGGSGTAPDGYTFYLGIGVALALLVFALATYLRTQKDETPHRRPG